MKPADVRELDTTQLVITGLHEEIERMRPVYEAAKVWRRAPHTFDANCSAGDCDECEAKHALTRLEGAIDSAISRDTNRHPVANPDADLWRAKAVQLAAALEEACELVEGESGRQVIIGRDPDVDRVQQLRALLTGDLAEPLAKLKRLREAVERVTPAVDASVAHSVVIRPLIAAAREVLR
jgi:hypothetical protein